MKKQGRRGEINPAVCHSAKGVTYTEEVDAAYVARLQVHCSIKPIVIVHTRFCLVVVNCRYMF